MINRLLRSSRIAFAFGSIALLATLQNNNTGVFLESADAAPIADEITSISVKCKCSSTLRSSGFEGQLFVMDVSVESAWHCTDGTWIKTETGMPGLPSHDWLLVEGCQEMAGPWLSGCEFQGTTRLYDLSDLTTPLGSHSVSESLTCDDFRFVHVGTLGQTIAPGSGPTAGVYGLLCSSCESAEALPE